MSDPRRLLDEGATDFERTLLESASEDKPSDAALRSTLAAMGLGAPAMAAGAAAAGATAKASLGAVTGVAVAKWVAIGTAGVLLTAGAVHQVVKHARHARPAPTPIEAPADTAVVAPTPVPTATPRPPVVEQPEIAPSLPVAAEAAPSPASNPHVIQKPAMHPAASHVRPSSSSGRGLAARPAPHEPAVQAPDEPAAPEIGAAPKPVEPAWAPAPSTSVKGVGTAAAEDEQELNKEVVLIDRAHRAIQAGHLDEAKALIAEYQTRCPNGQMAPEATLEWVKALVRAGDRPGAEAAARAYLDRNPLGPYAKQIRALLRSRSTP